MGNTLVCKRLNSHDKEIQIFQLMCCFKRQGRCRLQSEATLTASMHYAAIRDIRDFEKSNNPLRIGLLLWCSISGAIHTYIDKYTVLHIAVSNAAVTVSYCVVRHILTLFSTAGTCPHFAGLRSFPFVKSILEENL